MVSTADVLIFSAHPDDAEMSMAGTMIKLVSASFKVHHIVLTRSEMSTHGDVVTRESEFMDACRIIGCTGQFLDFQDTGVENTRENRLVLARFIRELKPRIIFAPYHTNPISEMRGQAHVDHYSTGSLVRDAVKMARLEKALPGLARHEIQKTFFYMVPKNVIPNLYVDISDTIDQTFDVIGAYQSQMAIGSGANDIMHVLTIQRAAAGIIIGVKYAECFISELPLRMTAQQFFQV